MTELRCHFCVTVSTKTIKNFYPGSMVRLQCQPGSNLAQVRWHVNDHPVKTSNTYHIHHNSLLILNASDTNAGHYTCTSEESSNGNMYVTQITTYELRLENFIGHPSIQPLVQEQQNTLLALKVLVIILTLILLLLVSWNFYKRYFAIPGCFNKAEERPQNISGFQEPLQIVNSNKAAATGYSSNSNNNHNRRIEFHNTGNQHNGDKVF